MARERLLKRIRRWSEQEDTGITELDFESYKRSVLDDLSKIYNCRQGTVMLDPEFGIPDFTSLMSHMGAPEIERLANAFNRVTRQYEPRLNVLFRYYPKEEDSGLIRFMATGKLRQGQKLSPIEFDVLLLGDGSVALQVKD